MAGAALVGGLFAILLFTVLPTVLAGRPRQGWSP